jgi:transketolase
MAASKFRLANLTAIIDYNNVQLDGPVSAVMPLEPLADKWAACGWHVVEVNGHSVQAVAGALDLAHQIHNRPTAVIAYTTKGRGVSFMENLSYWHGNVPNTEQFKQALIELGEVEND